MQNLALSVLVLWVEFMSCWADVKPLKITRFHCIRLQFFLQIFIGGLAFIIVFVFCILLSLLYLVLPYIQPISLERPGGLKQADKSLDHEAWFCRRDLDQDQTQHLPWPCLPATSWNTGRCDTCPWTHFRQWCSRRHQNYCWEYQPDQQDHRLLLSLFQIVWMCFHRNMFWFL